MYSNLDADPTRILYNLGMIQLGPHHCPEIKTTDYRNIETELAKRADSILRKYDRSNNRTRIENALKSALFHLSSYR